MLFVRYEELVSSRSERKVLPPRNPFEEVDEAKFSQASDCPNLPSQKYWTRYIAIQNIVHRVYEESLATAA